MYKIWFAFIRFFPSQKYHGYSLYSPLFSPLKLCHFVCLPEDFIASDLLLGACGLTPKCSASLSSPTRTTRLPAEIEKRSAISGPQSANQILVHIHSATSLIPLRRCMSHSDSFRVEMAAKIKSSVVFFPVQPTFGCINKTGKALASSQTRAFSTLFEEKRCARGLRQKAKGGRLEISNIDCK